MNNVNIISAFILHELKMVRKEVIGDIIRTLEEESGPLYVKEIAKRTGFSPNTVGKYIDVLEAAGKVVTKKYAATKQVSLIKRDD